jgi:hypothetical protein
LLSFHEFFCTNCHSFSGRGCLLTHCICWTLSFYLEVTQNSSFLFRQHLEPHQALKLHYCLCGVYQWWIVRKIFQVSPKTLKLMPCITALAFHEKIREKVVLCLRILGK